jgi:hypothetical protein
LAVKYRYVYTISRAQIDGMGTPALIDMLRYDGATPLGVGSNGTYMFTNTNGPTVGRWQSFGIRVIDSWKERI